MARTVKDTNLETRAARLRLKPRRKPYWRVLETGLHIGYRRVKDGGGSWVARRFIGDRRYNETRIATADDLQDADGAVLQTFKQAQEAARTWWKAAERAQLGLSPETGPYTVAAALLDYFKMREHRGSKGVTQDRSAATIRILPPLGDVILAKLTSKQIRDWHHGLAKAPRHRRAGRLTKRPQTAAVNVEDAETVRARRATANRTLTILKAALNYAYHEGRATSDEPWRKVKPFREADAPVVRFLSDDECRRLVNACAADFRDIVRGALLTGCRYGELTRMAVADFNSEVGTITVRMSKASKPRHVALTDEGRALFAELTIGHTAREPIFLRADSRPWGPSHQQRPLEAACRRAKIEPTASFHILRHTYASALAMRGVPMGVIAAQLGHSDTRMTERHYAHLSPNYVAETVRANLPPLGIVAATNIVPMIPKGGKLA